MSTHSFIAGQSATITRRNISLKSGRIRLWEINDGETAQACGIHR